MRVAVIIIALSLVMVIGVQSCAVGLGSSLTGDQETAQAGAYGVLMAFLFVLGAAFALRLPGVSAIIFIGGGALAIGGSATGGFKDLAVWGSVSIVLGLMAFLGKRELQPRQSPVRDYADPENDDDRVYRRRRVSYDYDERPVAAAGPPWLGVGVIVIVILAAC